MCTRTFKLLPHLWYRPSHIIYVPAWILFGYYLYVALMLHIADISSAIMKLYALFTLHETGWGTRAGIGDRMFRSHFAIFGYTVLTLLSRYCYCSTREEGRIRSGTR
jgi:hypothetical protein